MSKKQNFMFPLNKKQLKSHQTRSIQYMRDEYIGECDQCGGWLSAAVWPWPPFELARWGVRDCLLQLKDTVLFSCHGRKSRLLSIDLSNFSMGVSKKKEKKSEYSTKMMFPPASSHSPKFILFLYIHTHTYTYTCKELCMRNWKREFMLFHTMLTCLVMLWCNSCNSACCDCFACLQCNSSD